MDEAAALPLSHSAVARDASPRARWHYLDAALQHEVHATFRPDASGAAGSFVILEGAWGERDPARLVIQRTSYGEAWEAQLLHWELEGRLALMGHYVRSEGGGPWHRLSPRPGTPRFEPRPVDARLAPGAVEAHHFHQRGGAESIVLLALPRRADQRDHYAVAEVHLEDLCGELARIDIIHEDLGAISVRSLVGRLQYGLRERAFDKLIVASDFELAYGHAWRDDLRECYRLTQTRVRNHQLDLSPAPAPPPDAGGAMLRSDYLRWINNPKLRALHTRYLRPEEEQTLLNADPLAITRAIRRRRQGASHAEQHLLSLLEASLTARVMMRSTYSDQVPAEVALIIQRVGYYI